jgi:hypothetical protein
LVGEQNFDPQFSDISIKWLREAEIKHGQSACSRRHWGCPAGVLDLAVWSTWTIQSRQCRRYQPHVANCLGVGMEFWTNRVPSTMEDMFADDKQVPNLYWVRSHGLSKNKVRKNEAMQLKKSRMNACMMAIGSMIHHNWVTGMPCLRSFLTLFTTVHCVTILYVYYTVLVSRSVKLGRVMGGVKLLRNKIEDACLFSTVD